METSVAHVHVDLLIFFDSAFIIAWSFQKIILMEDVAHFESLDNHVPHWRFQMISFSKH